MEMKVSVASITRLVEVGMADNIVSEIQRLEAENKKLKFHCDIMSEWITEHVAGQNHCLDPIDICDAYKQTKQSMKKGKNR